jgi:hypothetical protein
MAIIMISDRGYKDLIPEESHSSRRPSGLVRMGILGVEWSGDTIKTVLGALKKLSRD